MNIFSFIKEHVSILEIIGHYTTLKKAGTYWKGPCPFHNERTGSFTVSPHREMFYCFGCHVGGDLVNFITKAENCSPIEAVKFLADRYSITLPESLIKEIPQQKSAKERYYETHKAAALWMTKQLENDREALTYIHKRGITPQVCSTYMLGWFPGGVRGTRMLMRQ